MFKHCACKVVGWVLHPADQKAGKGSERMLKYLPACIYVQFEGATWRVHQNLPQGVFPLKAVKRTWTVNAQTEAKATRKGYQLLPDFACTAHMVQGTTLLALIADCGDVMDNPLLKDMLAAYVALSRVRAAHGLLLLRAFSRNLFRQGPPPGPHCLMKILRARCNGHGNTVYTFDDALAEYRLLLEQSEREKALRK